MSKQKNQKTRKWWLGLLFLLFAVFMSSPDPKIITAESGQDVTLTCRAPNNNIRAVEWRRADLEDKYVLLYRDGHFERDEQHPSFKNRVDLQDRQMKDGDVSLILKNVTINDTGRYKCQAIQGIRTPMMLITIIYLHVDPPVKRIMSRRILRVGDKVITESGQDVTLTCRAPNNNTRVVEWNRADLGDKYVLLYRDGNFDPDNQHPSFKNRVDLQDRQMKDGDVSLILKDVTINDTGTYECGVILTGTRSLKPINSTDLHVVLPGPSGVSIGLSVSAVLLVVAVVGFLIYRRCNLNPADPHVAERLQPEYQKTIPAESGQDVTLTCRAVNNESEKMNQQLHQPEVDPTQTETFLSV